MKVSNLDHLGIVAGIIEKMEIAEEINTIIGKSSISGQMFDSEDNLIWGIEDALHSRYDALGFDTSYGEFSYA